MPDYNLSLQVSFKLRLFFLNSNSKVSLLRRLERHNHNYTKYITALLQENKFVKTPAKNTHRQPVCYFYHAGCILFLQE